MWSQVPNRLPPSLSPSCCRKWEYWVCAVGEVPGGWRPSRRCSREDTAITVPLSRHCTTSYTHTHTIRHVRKHNITWMSHFMLCKIEHNYVNMKRKFSSPTCNLKGRYFEWLEMCPESCAWMLYLHYKVLTRTWRTEVLREKSKVLSHFLYSIKGK